MRKKRLWIQVFDGDRHNKLGAHASFASNLFTFYLPKVSIKKTGKLVVEFLSTDDAFFIFPKSPGESVYTVRETFPFEDFAGTDRDKLLLLANETVSALTKLYKHVGLNPADIISGYNTIVENNFKLKIDIFKKSNRRQMTATLTVEYFLDFALLYFCFTDNEGTITKKLDLFKTVPHQLFYSQLIHSGRWVGDDTFQVFNKSKETRINIHLNGEIKIEYYPIGRDIDGIKKEIRHYSLSQFVDIEAGKNCNMKILK